MASTTEPKAFHARVRGRVQGVGYRHATVRAARDHGVFGWVRNDADGSVEVWAEGPAEAVDRFERFLRVGPMAATVDAVLVTPAVVAGASSFDVRY